ncbi:MAG: DUF4301 family protein [Bacteroidales bacterium]|nr:DUF4301 family protein [Bacteroidales bacterium]
MFTEKDLAQMSKQGIDPQVAEAQVIRFKNGFKWLEIVAPATPEKGIVTLTQNQMESLVSYYESARIDGKCKFVPASGAASRMFKDLFAGLVECEKNLGLLPDEPAAKFVKNIGKFAFYTDELFKDKTPLEVLSNTLTETGLNYGKKPKGVLKFHKYHDEDGSIKEIRTAFAEHLVEAQEYLREKDGKNVNLVVTVSPEHLELFIHAFDDIRDEYEKRFNCKFNVRFTFQDPATDTIAVDEHNKPFRTLDGSLLFRPAGHGALIGNLNAIESELVTIKNIDNVALEKHLPVTSLYKKVLMGKALEIRDILFDYIRQIDAAKNDDELLVLCNEIESYLDRNLCITIPNIEFASIKDRAAVVRQILNRPVRVCGMVRNEGEPGGGPFIVKGNGGVTSLQILESVQINKADENAVAALSNATHFNPVDLVCCIKDYKGDKFDLNKFVDNGAGFISSKSYEGRPLKALELPGLWNGAMSNWNTCFIEVPVETFTPVKTVLDLLRPAHC